MQPWAPKTNFPPARLSFGTWKEFGDKFHVNFYTVKKIKPCVRLIAIVDSLDYAWRLTGRCEVLYNNESEITSELLQGVSLLVTGNSHGADYKESEIEAMDTEVDEGELDARRAAWSPPEPRYRTGALAKYAALVGSAESGAVCG